MARRSDKILILDLEATCWERGKQPRGQESDIIEIGMVSVDLFTLKIDDSWSVLVKPTTSKVSEFCVGLTGITQEMVNGGVPFHQVQYPWTRELRRDRAWGSWGDYDRAQLERQCDRDDVHYPFGRTHLNLKYLFSVAMGLKKEVGMAEALDLLNMPLQGSHHRALDDATNIALIFCEITRRMRKNEETNV